MLGFKKISDNLAVGMEDRGYSIVAPGILSSDIDGDLYRWLSIVGNNYLVTCIAGVGSSQIDHLVHKNLSISLRKRLPRLRERSGPPVFSLHSESVLGIDLGVIHSESVIGIESVTEMLILMDNKLEEFSSSIMNLTDLIPLSFEYPTLGSSGLYYNAAIFAKLGLWVWLDDYSEMLSKNISSAIRTEYCDFVSALRGDKI